MVNRTVNPAVRYCVVEDAYHAYSNKERFFSKSEMNK